MAKKYVIKKSPPKKTYRAVIEIYEDDELVVRVGATTKANKFTDALPEINNEVQDKWIKVQQMAFVANEQNGENLDGAQD